MWEKALAVLIRIGRLTIIRPNGEVIQMGGSSPTDTGPRVTLRLSKSVGLSTASFWPELTLGEAYVDGSLTIESGSLWDFFELCGRNLLDRSLPHSGLTRLLQSIELWSMRGAAGRTALRNASHRYGTAHSPVSAFLDDDLQYSCAYFRDPTLSIDDAQAEKKRLIVSKLLLEAGQRVLDIGCGWGGLAIAIAQSEAVHTIGLTISEEQRALARRRAREAGVDHKINFELGSHHTVEGRFDRIVSIGLFERVKRSDYDPYFIKIASLLADDGVALVHSICRGNGLSLTCAWTRELLAPGGYVPTLSEVLVAIERSGLLVTDIEILRLHHADTLRAWRGRLTHNREQIVETYDERFVRMWEFYLAANEMAFRYGDLMVFQIQLAKRVDTVPRTRDYMFRSGHAPPVPAFAESV